MRELAINKYKQEYDRRWYEEEYSVMPAESQKRFTYLYIERLIKHRTPSGFVDQLSKLKELLGQQIESGISSNRHHAITWEPDVDVGAEYPPCLQRIWIRYYPEGWVDVHFEWRSRDLFDAWQGNLVGLVDMVFREIISPNNCKIGRIVDKSDSLHIYEGELGQATQVLALERERVPDFVKSLEYKYRV